jgi:oxygen-independent coproporphyrinogen-3 oxidase
MMNALRLKEGVPATLFTERTGLAETAVLSALQRLETRKLMEIRYSRWRCTPTGYPFLNRLLQEFLTE